MNIILGIINIILVYSAVLIIDKYLKKEGLIVWITFATITANIIVCKSIDIFSVTLSLGNILFASNFLATNIISEKYNKEDAYKAVKIALIMNILFVIFTQLSLLYIPSKNDIVNTAMKELFSINLRTTISSCIMLFISNCLGIYLFNKLKLKENNKLWFRSNVSTIISNCLENYLFVFFAFIGIFDLNVIFSIATTTTIIEIILSIVDTPFLYMIKEKNK